MSIDAVAVGDRIVYTWGLAVSAQLNKSYPLTVDANESTNSTSPSDVTGLTFTVENGSSYQIDLKVSYSCSATNQGIGIGVRHPGGDADGVFRVFGVSAAATEAIERLREQSANTDELTTAATVSSAGAPLVMEATIFYTCTADGTFAIRKARNGTSGSTGLTIIKGSRAIVTTTG